MPNILTLDHEDHILGNVAGVIPHPLQGAENPHHRHTAGNVAGIFHHERQQRPRGRLVFLIYPLVFLHDPQRLLGIETGKGVQGIVQHAKNMIANVAHFHVPTRRLTFL